MAKEKESKICTDGFMYKTEHSGTFKIWASSPYLSKALITILQGNTFTIQTTHGHKCQHGMAWAHD